MRAKIRGKNTRRHLAPRRMRPQEAWDLTKNVFQLKNPDKTTFYSPTETWVMPASSLKKPEEREFAVDSGASVHAEQKGFELRRTGNPRKIQETHNGSNCQWGSANKRGSTSLSSRS